MEYIENDFTDALIEHFERIKNINNMRKFRKLKYKRHNYVTRSGVKRMWIKRRYPSSRFSSIFY